jgi:hypothetical protein
MGRRKASTNKTPAKKTETSMSNTISKSISSSEISPSDHPIQTSDSSLEPHPPQEVDPKSTSISYIIAPGRAITGTKRGLLQDGDPIRAKDLLDGEIGLAMGIASGFFIPKE